MNYSYQILETNPKRLSAKVRYYAPDCDDVIKNVRVIEFSEQAIHDAIESVGHDVVALWKYAADAPEELSLSVTEKNVTYTEPTPPENKPSVVDPIPDFDQFTQRIETDFEETADSFLYTHTVVDLTEAEQANFLEVYREQVKIDRNIKLMETDYWMMADTHEPTQAQLYYRQALRDITDQDGFPKNIVWPTKPE